MDAVLFGAGNDCRIILPFLEKQYHILYIVDNNEALWGSTLEEYEILPVNNILQGDFRIIITSRRYALGIILQLGKMGISDDRIYFCKEYCTDGLLEYKLLPLDARKAESTGKKLIEYDLLGAEEQESGCTKVLIFCTFYSVYTKQLIENMSKRYSDVEFGLLTKAEENKENIRSARLKHIYCFRTKEDLKTILEQIPVYDACHFLWMEIEWVYFIRLIREKARRLVTNIGGSDFYRADSLMRDYKNNLIMHADKIMAQTAATAEKFIEYYKNTDRGKVHVLPYGVEVLDYINEKRNCDKSELREKYHISIDKIIVTCGHNAGEEHQHMEMLEAVNKLPDAVKQKIVCVVPMTYPAGVEAYIGRVRDKLNEMGMEYLLLTDFMDFQSMAEYALISDIMIHVQTTDQLSSTMLEEMYAGSVVIAGSWLPYKSLHETGMYFIDVDAIPDVTAVLCDIVENIEEYKEKCRVNRELVWEHSSWERLASKWHGLWE